MAFTYNLASTDTDLLNISKVRFEIGDTVSGVGVRPDGSNLTDEEIMMLLTDESNDIKLAASRACDALSSAWSLVANEQVGPRKTELGAISEKFEKRATGLRSQSTSYAATIY